MRTRYTYTSYPNSKIATALDFFCHAPVRIAFFAIPALLAVYLSLCAEHLPAIENLINGTVYVLLVLTLVFFLGSFFLGILCDKCQLSKKLAMWDIRRKEEGKKHSTKFWIVIILIVLLLAAPGVAAICSHAQSEKAADTYHESMTALDSENPPEITGSKFVSFHTGEKRYSTRFIPEHLQAETPWDVRYVLHCTDGDELYGMYDDINIAAYRRTYLLELYDRETGALVASETIYGANPPSRVDDDVNKAVYGDYPAEADVMAWVEGLLK